MNVYIVTFKKYNRVIPITVAAFTTEALAKIYCRIRNKDAWIDKGQYEYEEVRVQDDNPELIEFVLKGEADG